MSAPSSAETTLTDPSAGPGSREVTPPSMLALVVAWAAGEPDRIGEIALLPPGSVFVLGRGAAQPDDPHPRLQLVQQRPGSLTAAAPISNAKISRVQLVVSDAGSGRVRVQQVGRCPLLHAGRAVDALVAAPGDAFALGSQVVFLVMRRAAWLPAASSSLPAHPFGRADEHGIVGESPAVWQLRQRVAFVAPSDEHVLVTGPTGTGKELVAAALHRASARRDRAWVARNAATIPDALVDAELFGNARNYPNAGMPERPGLVGEANASTLFLDEFAELPSAAQAHLLRALDAGEYQRLGDSVTRRSSFRLVAATNRPPASLKQDVAARLRLRIDVPGLEQRREDVPLLLVHALRDLARRGEGQARRFFTHDDPEAAPRISPELITEAVSRSYPANVRELQRLVWDAVAGSPADRLELPATPTPAAVSAPPLRPTAITPDAIQACLDRHEGRLDLSWQPLGLPSRHALARLVAKHGLRAGRSWRPPGP